MQDTIQRFVLPSLTKTQQFLMNLLSGILMFIKILSALALQDKNKVINIVEDYYEQRLEKEHKQIENLENQNKILLEENKSLNAQAVALRQEKTYISSKLKAANNMLRILTKTKEDVNNCKTPVKINVLDIDNLLQKRLNEPTQSSDNKKSVHVKLLPTKVVQKKEVKKVALPKGKENVFCSKSTLKKDIGPKQKELASSALRKQPKILPKNPLPKTSVILFKSKQNQDTDRGTLRIPVKPKGTGKIESKRVLVDNQTKVKLTKRFESKIDDSTVQKNLNETFTVGR